MNILSPSFEERDGHPFFVSPAGKTVHLKPLNDFIRIFQLNVFIRIFQLEPPIAIQIGQVTHHVKREDFQGALTTSIPKEFVEQAIETVALFNDETMKSIYDLKDVEDQVLENNKDELPFSNKIRHAFNVFGLLHAIHLPVENFMSKKVNSIILKLYEVLKIAQNKLDIISAKELLLPEDIKIANIMREEAQKAWITSINKSINYFRQSIQNVYNNHQALYIRLDSETDVHVIEENLSDDPKSDQVEFRVHEISLDVRVQLALELKKYDTIKGILDEYAIKPPLLFEDNLKCFVNLLRCLKKNSHHDSQIIDLWQWYHQHSCQLLPKLQSTLESYHKDVNWSGIVAIFMHMHEWVDLLEDADDINYHVVKQDYQKAKAWLKSILKVDLADAFQELTLLRQFFMQAKDEDFSAEASLINELVKKAKVARRKSLALTAPAASGIGLGKTLGLQTIRNLTNNSESPISEQCVNAVFVLPKHETVLKAKRTRVEEDEKLVEGLWPLFGDTEHIVFSAHLPKYEITETKIDKNLHPSLFNFRKDIKSLTRSKDVKFGIKWKKGATKSRTVILNSFTKKDQAIWNDLLTQRNAFYKYKDQIFKIEDRHLQFELSFENLLYAYHRGLINDEAKIKGPQDKIFEPLEIYRLLSLEFGIAFDYDPNYIMEDTKIIPRFKTEQERQKYEDYDNRKWLVKGKNVSFKLLRLLYLNERITLEEIIEQNNNLKNPIELKHNLEMPWKLFFSRTIERKVPKIDDLRINLDIKERYILVRNLQAKPFVPFMSLFTDLAKFGLVEAVLDTFDDGATFAATITLFIQTQDLYQSNIGITIKKNEFFEKYQSSRFRIEGVMDNEEMGLHHLAQRYRADQITLDTVVVCDNLKKAVKEDKELVQALEVSFKPMFFDTDRSLGNHNWALKCPLFRHRYVPPIRSAFLGTNWRLKEYSDELIKRFLNSKERNEQIMNWINQKDNLIRKKLSEPLQKKIDLTITQLMSKREYSLSHFRALAITATYKNVLEVFLKEFTQLKEPYLEIWEAIQNELAKDLTSDSEKAAKERDRIAKKLVKRISLEQSKALEERLERLDFYLLKYQELRTSTYSAKDTCNKLLAFVKNTSVLNSHRKTYFINNSLLLISQFNIPKQAEPQLKTSSLDEKEQVTTPRTTSFSEVNIPVESQPKTSSLDEKEQITNPRTTSLSEDVEGLKKALLKETYPCFANIAKAIYPCLADILALQSYLMASIFKDSKDMIEREKDAGAILGEQTIDADIELGLAQPVNSAAYVIASELKKKLLQLDAAPPYY